MIKTKAKALAQVKTKVKNLYVKHKKNITRKINKHRFSKAHNKSNASKQHDIILQVGGNNKNRVLIVVDVQKCFFENFGTMGWLPKDFFTANNDETKEKMNNERDRVKREFAKKLNTFIQSAQTAYDIIIFTKDRHPIGHRSFGTYPPHCINKEKQCKFSYSQDKHKKKKEQENIAKSINNTHTHEGHTLISANATDLEDFHYDYKISYGGDINTNLEITKLSDLNLEGTIQYEETIDNKTKHKPTTLEKLELTKNKGRPSTSTPNSAIIVRLNKGELCNFDAYGAFVYHVEYENKKENIEISADKHGYTNATRRVDIYNEKFEYNPEGETNILNSLNTIKNLSRISTGLGEFLLKYYGGAFAKNMVIDVCGLVTNICVVNSCIGGIKLFENIKTRLPATKLLDDFNIPHFRILNEYSLYLYVFKLSETQCLENAKISYKIYDSEYAYNSDIAKVDTSHSSHSVSIIGTLAVDKYTPKKNKPIPTQTSS